MTSISQQGSRWKELTHGFDHVSRRLSPWVAILAKLFQQITRRNELSVSFDQHDLNNFCNLSRLIFEKGGFTLVLANHRTGTFLFKRAFLGESQRPVRRLSNQISKLRLETHSFVFTVVLLTFMLLYRFHGFSLTKLSVWKAGASKL